VLADEPGVFTGEDLSQGVELRVATGSAVVFSSRCPGKPSPNEDAAAVISLDDRRGVLVVADGLGGRPGGASASDIAVRAVEAHVRRVVGNGDSVRTAILDAVDEANHAIMELGIGAGTTVAIVEIDGARLRAYHVGDSAILVVGQRGRLKLQTISHSPTGYAVESGFLDEAAALQHEERHLVSNIIGDTGMRIEIGSWLKTNVRDTILLATDGLFDNLRASEIVEIVRTGPLTRACMALSEVSADRMSNPREGQPSKPDDLTFILFRPTSSTRRVPLDS
jgi:serine/threonine protein phosphatase PrpC